MIKRELKIRPIHECWCDERLKAKVEESTRLTYTGFLGELEHLKIKTRLIDEKFASVMGEYVFLIGLLVDKDDLINYQLLNQLLILEGLLMIVDNVWKLTNTVRVGLALTKVTALRLTLNLDGVPITSKSHTHPSHSQTSRLLTSSLSLGVPVPRGTQCMRVV